MSKLSPEAKAELNRKLDKQAQDMVAKGRGTVDPTGKPTIGVDVRDEKPEGEKVSKAFALEHPAPGLWNMATIHYQDDQIVKVERTEPNVKAIAVNELKMTNARHWMNLG